METIKMMVDELILLITKKKISKTEMAEYMGCSRPYLNKLIIGEGRTLDFAKLLDFCRGYKGK